MEVLNIQTIILISLVFFFCLISLLAGQHLGLKQGRKLEEAEWRTTKIEEIVKSRLKTSRAVLGGQISEQIAPLLPGFPYDPADCRFIGKPIDFLIFKGMAEKNITEVIFLEVKTGSAKALSTQEKHLRDAIIEGKVKWEMFNP